MIEISQIVDPEVLGLAQEARSFLSSFQWCASLVRGELAFAIPGVLGVFRFQLIPATAAVDDVLWVVVGDLPAAYIALPTSASWRQVLAGYVDEMQLWIDAVRSGTSVGELIPVNVPATTESAALLDRRLTFIRENLLSGPEDGLESAG